MTLITFHDGKAVMRDGKIGVSSECCCGCGRCVVPPHVIVQGDTVIPVRGSYAEPRWRTREECERCRMCVESLSTECNGDCPGGAVEIPVSLAFSADCGSGAAGTVKVGCGAVLSATLTDGGSGYAAETISAPTLTATAPGGTGGVLSINGYAKIVGGLFDGYYVPTGITVVSGGSGYTDNAQVTLSLGTNDEWAPGSGAPNIRIRTTSAIRPPVDQWILTPGATAPTGTGLVISMTFSTTPEFDSLSGLWIFRAQSVSVVNGGSGYAVGQTVGPRAVEGNPASTVGRAVVRITQVNAAGSVLSVAFGTGVLARGRYRVDAGAPVDQWTLTPYSSNGSGLVVSLTLALVDFGEEGYAPGYGPIYEATTATVVNGGTGYEVGTEIAVEGSTTVEGNPTVVVVSSVDGNGAVTGLSVLFGGYHEGTDTGVISSVVITSNRPARKRAIEVCEVAVSVVQEAPSNGTGATITATVESNPASQDFGKVTGLAVANGGSGYVALCERKTTVGSCEDCQPRESPESATCEETGGCPCGTWVVDSDQTACECCKWTNPSWGVALMNLSDGHGGQIQYMDKEVECDKLRDKLLLIRSHFEAAGWTVTLDENWCPPNVLDVWATTHGGDPDDIQIPLYPEDPCACGFLFRAECESCNRAYPAHIWTEAYRFLVVDDPEVGLRPFEARPFDPSQWVEMPIEDWQHDVPTPYAFGIVPLWPISFGGFARVVYCEGLHAPSGVTIHKNPLGSSVPVFNFAKWGFQNVLLYGDFYISGQIHGGGLIPGYYSKGDYIEYDNDTFTSYQRGGKIYIPKCGVEITERARCVRNSVLEGGTGNETYKVLDDTWATCCAECPAGYRCIFAGDPLDYTVIEANPLP